MNDDTHWIETNQQYLMRAIGRVRAVLEGRATGQQRRKEGRQSLPAGDEAGGRAGSPQLARRGAPAEHGAYPATEGRPATLPPALDTLCATFGLSAFERDVLLLCAGIELDLSSRHCVGPRTATDSGISNVQSCARGLPDLHWSALAPNAPLRWWRLIEISNGNALTTSPLRIDERILHYLTGIWHLDDRLAGLVEPVRIADELAPSQRVLAEGVIQTWSDHQRISELPVVQLCGD